MVHNTLYTNENKKLRPFVLLQWESLAAYNIRQFRAYVCNMHQQTANAPA